MGIDSMWSSPIQLLHFWLCTMLYDMRKERRGAECKSLGQIANFSRVFPDAVSSWRGARTEANIQSDSDRSI